MWSSETLAAHAENESLYINPIIYSEVSNGFAKTEELEASLPQDYFNRENLPYEAAFLAGKCFLKYRRAGGVRRSPLPDFYIGAHAAVRGWGLLTRDKGRYETYFPSLNVIAPV